MPTDPAALAALLRAQEGVISHAQARRFGLSTDYLEWRVERGRWQRPLPRTYVAQSGPLTAMQRRWAALVYCGDGAVLGCHTAAALHGLRGYADADVHVCVPEGRQPRSRDGVVGHQTLHLAEADVQPLAVPPRTRIERSLLDLAGHARSIDDAVAVLAAGVQQRLTTGGRLAGRLRERHSQKYRRQLLDVCDDLAGGSHSVIEVEASRVLRRARLPTPDRQLRLLLPDRTARVDCCWDGPGVVAELDGRMHMEVAQWVDDLDRQNELALSARVVLRYPLWTLRFHPERVAQQLRRALDANRF